MTSSSTQSATARLVAAQDVLHQLPGWPSTLGEAMADPLAAATLRLAAMWLRRRGALAQPAGTLSTWGGLPLHPQPRSGQAPSAGLDG